MEKTLSSQATNWREGRRLRAWELHHKGWKQQAIASPEQRGQLLELLAQGAEAFGFPGDVWTQPRVAALIRDRFGVSYDPSQVGRILKACGWSRQRPVHRATQRDAAAIRQWQEERWPEIKKRP
jgi:transposase